MLPLAASSSFQLELAASCKPSDSEQAESESDRVDITYIVFLFAQMIGNDPDCVLASGFRSPLFLGSETMPEPGSGDPVSNFLLVGLLVSGTFSFFRSTAHTLSWSEISRGKYSRPWHESV